jgi:branched-chain amino acid aminotransferase
MGLYSVIFTPELSASILPRITRETVTEIARDLGHCVVEKPLVRTDFYLADESSSRERRRR